MSTKIWSPGASMINKYKVKKERELSFHIGNQYFFIEEVSRKDADIPPDLEG